MSQASNVHPIISFSPNMIARPTYLFNMYLPTHAYSVCVLTCLFFMLFLIMLSVFLHVNNTRYLGTVRRENDAPHFHNCESFRLHMQQTFAVLEQPWVEERVQQRQSHKAHTHIAVNTLLRQVAFSNWGTFVTAILLVSVWYEVFI